MRAGAARGRVAVVAVAALLALGPAACGGDPSPYCQAVEKNRESLDTFGARESDKGFATYARVLESISEVAPEPIDEQWASLGRATRGVVTAHASIGFAMEDMSDDDKLSTLSAGDVEVLNKAYTRFNRTTGQREAVVDDARTTCDVTLKAADDE